MGRLYGRDEWNPGRIMCQIAAMQVVFYVFYTAAMWLLRLAVGSSLFPYASVVTPMFTPESIGFSSLAGWLMIACLCITAICCACALVYIVERAKKCLDFTFTVFFLHFVGTCAYSGFPAVWQWWLVQVAVLCGMNALGEYLCMRHELAEITVADIVRDRGEEAMDLGLSVGTATGRSGNAASRMERGHAGGGSLSSRGGGFMSRLHPAAPPAKPAYVAVPTVRPGGEVELATARVLGGSHQGTGASQAQDSTQSHANGDHDGGWGAFVPSTPPPAQSSASAAQQRSSSLAAVRTMNV